MSAPVTDTAAARAAPSSQPAMRIRHTMLRVSDLERSIAFYTGHLGMRVMRLRDNPREHVAYVGYGDERTNHALELIQERQPGAPRVMGNCYGHIAVAVPDIEGLCARMKRAGVPFAQELMPSPSGKHRIAFILDPDGFEVELTERV